MIKLDNKVAIVTGAARGMGFATARTLLASGAEVAMLDIDGKLVAESAAALTADGYDNVLALQCDVSDRASIDRAIAATTERFARINILANIAGAYVASTTQTHLSSEQPRR